MRPAFGIGWMLGTSILSWAAVANAVSLYRLFWPRLDHPMAVKATAGGVIVLLTRSTTAGPQGAWASNFSRRPSWRLC